MSFKIIPFVLEYQSQLINLIERIQLKEFDIPISKEQRQELQSIPEVFQKEKGNYWIALFNQKVIGSIAVLDIKHKSLELRDVFLDEEYRGPVTDYAQQLLKTVLDWAKKQDVKFIYLGTTLKFQRAHRFYEKHGFIEIQRNEMPDYCKPMACDEKFYKIEF